MNNLQYSDILRNKNKILQSIRINVHEQSKMLEEKDYSKLEGLSRECGIQILNLKKEIDVLDSSYIDNRDEGALEYEKLNNLLSQEIVELITLNNIKAESLKEECAAAIRHLRMGKNAINNGYFKRMPQRYGCFIDKKLGSKV